MPAVTRRQSNWIMVLLLLAILVWLALAEPSPPWTNENFR
jgi:hypothetical protein